MHIGNASSVAGVFQAAQMAAIIHQNVFRQVLSGNYASQKTGAKRTDLLYVSSNCYAGREGAFNKIAETFLKVLPSAKIIAGGKCFGKHVRKSFQKRVLENVTGNVSQRSVSGSVVWQAFKRFMEHMFRKNIGAKIHHDDHQGDDQ